jgi:predicted nucleotidyltransferase
MSTLDRFIEDCRQIFEENLVCILLVGSVYRGDTTPFSDVDLILILKTMNSEQVTRLRTIVRSLEILIDCSILCADEIPADPNRFRLGSHGCYQLELVLKKARCVWGTNPLLVLPSPSRREIRKSIVDKITEYTWWVRRMFIESNKERSLKMNYQMNSRIVKMIRDILFLKQGTSIDDPTTTVISTFISEHKSQLTHSEKKALRGLGNVRKIGRNAADMSDTYFLVRYIIANKIYKWTMDLAI